MDRDFLIDLVLLVMDAIEAERETERMMKARMRAR